MIELLGDRVLLSLGRRKEEGRRALLRSSATTRREAHRRLRTTPSDAVAALARAISRSDSGVRSLRARFAHFTVAKTSGKP